jgi:hypothetical protein
VQPYLPVRARLAALFVGLTLGGCSCDGDVVVGGTSSLASDRLVLDFGRVFIGQSRTQTLLLSAPGELPVTFEGTFLGNAGGFAAGPANGVVAANNAVEVAVTFAPMVAGERAAALIFTSDATRSATVGIELRALAASPPDCEDGNGCTVDTFDLNTGVCVHRAERLACDDFDACTISDTCVEAVCLGESRSCDDGNACTDDFCDAREGCINVVTTNCDDNNPCTEDICRPDGGCDNIVLDDGTPCNDLEQCTVADICVAGFCVGVPEGIECDDGDPCSKMEACFDGECLDPTYEPPGFGDVKFATDLGRLPPGAGSNVILDRTDNLFVATSSGVAAIDECGEVVWTNDTLGPSSFGAAVSFPGLLSLPIDGRIVDIDTSTGSVLREIVFDDVFETIGTATTATIAIAVHDVAVRASGSLVVSVSRTIDDGIATTFEGVLAEVDPTHSISTLFLNLGERWARRVAIDADEGVVAIVERGRPGDATSVAQVLRLGVGAVPGDTWSSSEIDAARTDLAIGEGSEVWWSAGLQAFSKDGVPYGLIPAPLDPAAVHAGSPLAVGERVHVVVRREDSANFAPGGVYHLLTISATTGETLSDIMFMDPVVGMSPVVDLVGNVYVLTGRGTLFGFTELGQLLFATDLPIDTSRRLDDIALAITSKGVVVGAAGGHAFGVQSNFPMSGAAWPRHRRDNLATGHR